MAARPHTSHIGESIRARRLARGWSVRHAAERAGLAPSTWSRIERGLRSADNRFVLSDIATALDCSVADLAGRPAATVDPGLAAAEAMVPAIRRALMETALDESAMRQAPAPKSLAATVELCRDLYRRTDYAGLSRLLPDLLFDLHAAAVTAPTREVLGMSVQIHLTTMATLKHVGHPADAWIAAERGREVARLLDDPVAIALSEFSRTCAATGCDGYGRAYTIASRAADTLDGYLQEPRALEALGLLTLRMAFSAAALRRHDEAADRFAEASRIAQRTGEALSWDMCFGPSNVDTWRIGAEADMGNPGLAVRIAGTVNPAIFASPVRASGFYMDTARALTHLRNDSRAIRMLLTAERLAPQHVRSAPLAREAARTLVERSHGEAGSQIRGFAERAGLEI